jgi:FHA domain-containing protein
VDVGALQRFERRLEGLVNGAFAKAFKADVQPVEIASGLQRELDGRAAIVSRGTTLIPNHFTVELGEHDYERLSMYAASLGEELAEVVRGHAAEQNYQLRGPVEVRFEQVDDLDIGRHRIRSSVVAGVAPVSEPRRARVPGAPGPSGRGAGAPGPGAGGPGAGGPGAGGPGAGGPGPGRPSRPGTPGADRAETQVVSSPTVWLEVHGNRHPLTRAITVLGRGTEVDLRIDDPGVSRQHAEIRSADTTTILDLGSTNGTIIDGRSVKEAELYDGARIVLGSTTLVFRRQAR